MIKFCKKNKIHEVNIKHFKGYHYTLPRLIGIYDKIESFKVSIMIPDKALYRFNDEDDKDINKIIGFSFGFNAIHIDSFRLGWNIVKGKPTIYAYTYNKGKRIIRQLDTIDFNKGISYTIKFDYDLINISRSNSKYHSNNNLIAINKDALSKTKYLLQPYFGGNKESRVNFDMKLLFKIL